ncbi:flagellar export protein FliJ [Pelomonas sp. KK5]|uniref:flagellar export protein FliJ n=1 Tax=Pelomonas sp. KK5 TaxID=1855730 RepID=UPI00097BFB83|nr:flagellar export protein FliJ [Pelomonas sp. KK5]
MSNSTTSLQTLGVLLERAEAERDEALKLLREAEARAAQAAAQASQLSQYRVDYRQRWTEQFSRQGTMDIVGCYQNFGGKLDQAVDSQGAIALHAQTKVERARALLAEKEMRVAAIGKLIERRRIEMGRAVQRQEQKLTDEQAARTAAGNNRNPQSPGTLGRFIA